MRCVCDDGEEARMVIVHRLHAGAPGYYLAAVGPGGGAHPRRGEAPGRWQGAGADDRGLAGEVDGPTLRRLLPTGTGRVPGFDVTFAAPKSVSLLHALGRPDVVDEVRLAHDAAVAAGLDYLERHACRVRVGDRAVVAGGFVAAGFRHRTSRAEDPHLHTHVVVVNAAAGPDGRWRALHSPLLYAERRGADATYHLVLRGRLTAVLGLRWDPPAAGRADAAVVPADVRAAFSRRRVALLVHASGEVADRRWAERVTRPARDGWIDYDSLTATWTARAAALGWSAPERGPGRPPACLPVGDELLPPIDRWTRSTVVAALADRWVEGASAPDVRATTERLLASAEVVVLGESAHASTRFTTRAAQARLEMISQGLRGRRVVLDAEAIDRTRRAMARDGQALVVVAADAVSADLAAARTGAPAEPAARALDVVRALVPGDLVVLARAERMASSELHPAIAAAAARGVEVVAAVPDRSAAPLGGRDGGGESVTVAISGGDVTASSTATLAADTAIGDWVARRRNDGAGVVVAEADEVAALNRRARAALREVGALGAVDVGGFSTGDVLRFTRARPSLGVGWRTQGVVMAADPVSGVRLRLLDGRDLDLRPRALHGLVHAHVVPPVPALVAGRGDVFVVGGRVIGARHIEGNRVHRYLTVDAAALRTRGWIDRWEVRPSRDAPPRTAGANRVAAATEWASLAADRLQHAQLVGDRAAAAVWRTQVHAAAREVRRQRVALAAGQPRQRALAPPGAEHGRPLAVRASGRDLGLSR